MGANAGVIAARRRLGRLLDGTYRRWAGEVLHAAREAARLAGVSPPPERISAYQIATEGRRRLPDRLLLAALLPLGVRARGPDRPGHR